MRSKRAESSLVIWRGKRGCLLDFRSVKYFSPRCPYVRGPPDGELGTTYRVTCPINSFIFRLENKFPVWENGKTILLKIGHEKLCVQKSFFTPPYTGSNGRQSLVISEGGERGEGPVTLGTYGSLSIRY